MPLRLLAMPLYNMVEGIVDACREQVQPAVGSILYCDLAFGYMEHSGVYIGNNRIVHLAGRGDIEVVSPKQFVSGGTGVSIYVSCRDTHAVGSSIVAERALERVGQSRDYNFVMDNCHQFSAGCLTGDFDNSSNFLWMLKDESKRKLKSDTWRLWDIQLFN